MPAQRMIEKRARPWLSGRIHKRSRDVHAFTRAETCVQMLSRSRALRCAGRRRLEDQSRGGRSARRRAAAPRRAAAEPADIRRSAGNRRHGAQARGEPAGRSVEHRRVHQEGHAESRHQRIRDYAEKVPSISFISVGPGTQLFVMRGVSDGSNPNYANTSATGFFVDDMSMSWRRRSARPASVRHRAHRGAERPAGHDLRRGLHVRRDPLHHQQARRERLQRRHRLQRRPDPGRPEQLDLRGISQRPAHRRGAGPAGFRLQRLPRRLHQQQAHDAHLGQRRRLRQLRQWARNDYNREHVEGGRVALERRHQRWLERHAHLQLSAPATSGAWDEDPESRAAHGRALRPGEPSRSKPKTLDFHLDGDVGIGDLVFASTYWSLPTRQQNEYSQYMENLSTAAPIEGVTCLNDPSTAPARTPAAMCRRSTTNTTPIRSAGPTNCGSHPSRAAASTGSAGLYWEKTGTRTPAAPSTCRDCGPTARRSSTTTTTMARRPDRPRCRRGVVRLHDAHGLSADHRIRQYQLRHHRQAQRRSGRRALSFRLPLLQPLTASSPMRRRRRA